MDLNTFIRLALAEDLGSGDHTSLACVPATAQSRAKLLVKDTGIIAGIEIAQAIYNHYDPKLQLELRLRDGQTVQPGDIAFFLAGSSQNILAVERLSLNIMQMMSGIATATSQVVKALEGTKCRVLDTRKTTPLNRFLQKEAVKIGGGTNHRIGLYDMVMIKDNHVDYAGGIAAAISATKSYLAAKQLDLQIEIETRNLQELDEVLRIGGVHRIMLDNYSFEDLRTAVARIDGQYETEASGGISVANARAYADCGVDFISIGALTHTVKNFDLSLKAC
ncbi:MAG: carboxylating nicotinate-nucleotide diphosphorylase [Sphingobacteriaceae bacterium]|nr:carboxylating nicotinate-nucleotide diphosphorylase [Sphingobacteriaceae bacterium]